MYKRKLRGGMIGGGYNSFIGPVHRMAATLDGLAEFVSGVFSADPQRSREFGQTLFLDPNRVHGSVQELVQHELSLPQDQRIDFVTICTPNDSHYEAVCASLDAGFHVICDKPVTRTLAEAQDLVKRVAASDRFFGLTHNYTGYPMVREAKHLIGQGAVGTIHKVVVEYAQGWLAPLLGNTDSTANPWRMDPARVGAACTMGDIGTHGENLLRFVTGLETEALCADLRACIPSNPLDDDGSILLRFKGGAHGVLIASQVSTGEENRINLRVYGSKGGLFWSQENPNYLELRDLDGTATILSKGGPRLSPVATDAGRLPSGHPDGFIEAFANIYRDCFRGIAGEKVDIPGIADGLAGMQFIETVVASGKSEQKWTPRAPSE